MINAVSWEDWWTYDGISGELTFVININDLKFIIKKGLELIVRSVLSIERGNKFSWNLLN